MKDIFFQLKSMIFSVFFKLAKKPLFFEILIGSLLSIAVISISVSGFEKAVYKEDFDYIENITDYDYEIDEESTSTDWDTLSELSRGDALSEIQASRTETSSINRNTAPPVITTPTPEPLILTTPSGTIAPIVEDEDEIIETPEETLAPEITFTPEPEVILDPNGPVIVTDMDSEHTTSSFIEAINITGYDPTGEKLSAEHFTVILNDSYIYPSLSFNGSFSYNLNYKEGPNSLEIHVSDNINQQKIYTYAINYNIPEKQPAIISVDAASIEMGYMVTPTSVEITEGKTVAAYVKEILSRNGYSTYSKGSQNLNYEFRGIYRNDLYSKCEPVIRDEILKPVLTNIDILTPSGHYNNFIKNGYFYASSKWIFEINGVKYFDSMSNYILNEGDVLRVRFTLNEGEDLDYLDTCFYPTDTLIP